VEKVSGNSFERCVQGIYQERQGGTVRAGYVEEVSKHDY
jgi:hypothetical protein